MDSRVHSDSVEVNKSYENRSLSLKNYIFKVYYINDILYNIYLYYKFLIIFKLNFEFEFYLMLLYFSSLHLWLSDFSGTMSPSGTLAPFIIIVKSWSHDTLYLKVAIADFKKHKNKNLREVIVLWKICFISKVDLSERPHPPHVHVPKNYEIQYQPVLPVNIDPPPSNWLYILTK